MLQENTVSFINNLARIASGYSSAMGKSVLALEAYDKKNYLRDFTARYELPPDRLQLVPANQTDTEKLRQWLCGEGKGRLKDRMIAKQFCWMLHRGFGDARIIHVLGEDRSALELLSRQEGDGPRFEVEDLFFAVYKEGTVCFLLGRSL